MDRRSFIAALTVTVASPLVPVLASESELEMLPLDLEAELEAAELEPIEEVESATFILAN